MKITSDMEKIETALARAFDRAAPITEKELKKELAATKRAAVANWPVRQQKYGPSQGSKGKIQTDLKRQGMTVEGSISNSAEYAWKIRAGADSRTNVARGKRIAEELLYKPSVKASNRIAKRLADQIVGKLRRN